MSDLPEIENPLPARLYPWGNQYVQELANAEVNIGSTSCAGCYPLGASPYGVEDMSGNVWEWTRSLWGKDYTKPQYKYPYQADDGRENLSASRDTLRVRRGGSFYSVRRFARCAFRVRYRPDAWSSSLGFRVVVSPFDPGL